MALNFGLLDTNAPAAIANSVTQGRQMAQQEKMAQLQALSAEQQLRTGAAQQEMTAMQLEQAKRERDALANMQAKFVANGKSPDMRANFQEMVQSGIPHFMDIGIKGMQALDRQDRVAKILGGGGEPTAAAPMAAPAPSIMRQPAAPTQNALGSGTYGMEPSAPVNALAPTGGGYKPTLPRNAMALPQGEQAAMENEYRIIEQLHMAGEHELAKSREQRLKLKSEATSPLNKLITERNALPPNDPMRKVYDARIAKETTHAPGTSVYLPPQEKAFQGELGKGQAEELLKGRAAARDAAAIIDTVNTGRDIMKSGMITGAGADFLVNFNQALKTAGIDAGYADAAANSQAFTANMAGNVGKLIKQFGAGTGLSDADREFAKDMAGGRISLDAKAINKILDINERAARNVISRHNKDVKGIKTNIPLEVEMPVEVKPAAAAKVVTNPQFPGFSVGKP